MRAHSSRASSGTNYGSFLFIEHAFFLLCTWSTLLQQALFQVVLRKIIFLRPWNIENKLAKLYDYCISELCPVRAVNIFERSCHQIHGVYLAGGYRHMTKGLMFRFHPVGWQHLATHRFTLDWAYLCAHESPWKAVLSRGKGWLIARWRPTRVPNGTTDCGDISAKSFFRNVWPWGISHREQVVYGSRKQCETWGWWHCPSLQG